MQRDLERHKLRLQNVKNFIDTSAPESLTANRIRENSPVRRGANMKGRLTTNHFTRMRSHILLFYSKRGSGERKFVAGKAYI